MGLGLCLHPPVPLSNVALCSLCNKRNRFPAVGTRTRKHFSSFRKAIANCSNNREEIEFESIHLLAIGATPYQVLGVDESCSAAELKAAFRARVKEFHPDVCKDVGDSDAIIRRVIQAYKILCKLFDQPATTERDCSDPFVEPECEALDLFVNEVLCVGKGCPYSCVKRAPHGFAFVPGNGTARAISQGHGDDVQVQLAVGQCPRSCIHYVTPSQRVILEELLERVLNFPYDLAEVPLLDSLISKAKFENNRYKIPKKQPKGSTQYADWF